MSFNVYRSSAGSGKTFTLVKEYLNLVLPDPGNFKHILAITFTNKAANEMKERVITTLKELSNHDENPVSDAVRNILSEISKTSGLSQVDLIKNAEKALKSILHNYSDFAISTIDSFMHRIIRTFAFDLHVPMNFEVEIEQDELLLKVVDILISRVGTEDDLTGILTDFIESKTDDEKSWNIEHDLHEVAKYLLKEGSQEFIEKIRNLNLSDFYSINIKIKKKLVEFEKKISTLAGQADEMIKAKRISHDAFYHGGKGISVYFENLKNAKFDKLEPNTYVVNTIERDKWYGGAANPRDKAAIDELKIALTEIYHKISGHIIKNKAGYIILNEIRKNIYPLAMVSVFAKIMDEYKSENEIVMISEFNEKIASIVLGEPVPFIYERLGEKYHHFLIDEFQDTSIKQWQNLLPLIENTLATDKFNMVVGDGKQAIYRWRGGEVEQFAVLPQIFKCPDNEFMRERQKSLVRNYEPKSLLRNFRSRKEIVEFNNDFFSFLRDRLPEQYRDIYSDVIQIPDPGNCGGLIEIEFFREDNTELNFNEFNIEKAGLIISNLRDEGFQFKDIAILCRSNRNAGEVAQALLQDGVPVISSESLYLGGSPEVRLLIAVMRLIVNQNDRIAMVEMISYLLKKNYISGKLHDQLEAFGVNRLNNNDAKSKKDFFKVLAQHGFNLQVIKLKNLTIYDMAEELIRLFNFHKKPDGYLQFFLDAVFQFSRGQNDELVNFISWWDDKGYSKSIVVPAGLNAVQVMTIHKAKGLQFPVVIYPFAREKHKSSSDKFWIEFTDPDIPGLNTAIVNNSKALLETPFSELYEDEKRKSLLDLMNILYVVMTRAVHRLYVITALPAKSVEAAESVPGFFKQFLEYRGLWNENNGKYTFGEKTKYTKKGKAINETYDLKGFISESWHNRMMLSLQVNKTGISDAQELTKRWGKKIHFILSRLNYADELNDVLTVLENDGIVFHEEKGQIYSLLVEFLSHPDVSKYFRKGIVVRNESEIIIPNGEVFRPDRVILMEDKSVVIDFKTGKPKDADKKQVKFYMDLMKEMGYQNIKGVILYLNQTQPEVVVNG